jgi:hypothetical protein
MGICFRKKTIPIYHVYNQLHFKVENQKFSQEVSIHCQKLLFKLFIRFNMVKKYIIITETIEYNIASKSNKSEFLVL